MKILFSLVLSLLTFQSFSQTTSEQLINDEDFQKYVITSVKFADQLSEKFTKAELVELTETFKNINLGSYTIAEAKQHVVNLLNMENVDTFNLYYETILTARDNIKDRYGDIDKEVFVAAADNIIINSSSLGPIQIKCEHPWRYSLCSGAAAFEGGLLLAACEGITAGVGSVFCVAGAITWLANEIQECKDKWCKK